ncbi:hypothetical protein HD806DRAFT_389389 [Xylariaceae sp. AK1471]|nr:hypothetical protein HD806DRAFT_389389 [Xylariaceae sp. AK1471]
MGHRRNSSSATAVQQGPSDGQPEKKKNFFASVTGISHHSQPKPKSNLGLARTSTFDESDQVSLQNPGDNVPVKKRLSELKGMIKGVGNAKEGAKDDQPVKVETIYESRQSMQGPPRNNPALTAIQGAQRQAGPFGPHAQPGQFGPQGQPNPYGLQAPTQAHPSQMGQPVMMSPAPFNGIGRAATAGPQSGHIQQVKSEESGKKGSAGGFLGGLFNKQANKTKEIKSQSPQQRPPSSQRPTQPPSMQPSHLPFSAGQMHLPGQHIGPHPMFAGQPPFQRGPPGQSPSPTLFQDPTQPPPSLQTAQVVTIRRPSEITVSTQGTQQPSNQRPNMPSPQGSQGTFKQHPGSSPLGQRSSQMGPQNDGSIVASQTSPQLSDKSSREKLTIGAPSTITRISPNRKPVGSANFKGDGPFMTSAISPSVVRPERSTASPSPRPSEQQRAPSQLSQARQSPQLASFGVSTDMRQPSLPSPVPSLVPSQSNHSSSPRLQGDQFARDSSEQGLGVFPNGISQPGPMNVSGPGGAPNALVWGPNGFRPAAPALAPPSAAARIQPPLAPSSPVPSMDQSKLSKFFGAYDGGKPAAQPQPQANKEKSAASKFLGAFKRSSKHNEAPQPQQRPQTSPQIPQSAIRPGVPGPVDSGAMPNPGSIPVSSGASVGQSLGPVQPGQGRGQVPVQVARQQTQASRGQPGQIPPQIITMQVQAGRGQISPGMIPGTGRAQPPPMFAGARPLPPQMQHPGAAGPRGNEPKYDQVPIPRGYEAVHGYGPGGMLAPSPYNAGRPGLPPMQYAQYPPTMQSGFPPRQWDPRVMPPSQASLPLGATPSNPQPASQGLPNNIPYQGPLQHPQLQGLTQNPSPNTQNLHLSPSQIQLSPQQFPQSQSAQESRQLSAPGQGQIPTQRAPSVQLQQTQSHGQGSQQGSSPASQAQSNVNWKGTPEKTQSPASVRQPNPPASNSVPQASVQAAPVSGSPASNGTPPPQSQHIAATVPSQPPQLVQANPARQPSPANQIMKAPTQVPVVSSQGQYDVQSPRSTAPTGGFLRSPDATRLTSRMSVSRQSIKSASPSTEKLADRTMSVSPEPPGPRHVPLHQVSEQNLSVNVERANSHAREGSEDIYDATPRLNNSKFQGEDEAHENTKYAGSEKSRVVTNGAAVAAGAAAGAGAGAGASSGSGSGSGTVTEDNMSFLDGPDDSEPDDSHAAEESKGEDLTISPPQRTATMNMEPEEKILVDEPVELAAVNDDDDGLPMMTATSYPGQEWNPYGAGEFGDWE